MSRFLSKRTVFVTVNIAPKSRELKAGFSCTAHEAYYCNQKVLPRHLATGSLCMFATIDKNGRYWRTGNGHIVENKIWNIGDSDAAVT